MHVKALHTTPQNIKKVLYFQLIHPLSETAAVCYLHVCAFLAPSVIFRALKHEITQSNT